jgi:hypothetical protein
MLLTCPRCSRINPAEALFCYQDGAALGDPSRRRDVSDPARKRFPMPFVFPSGQACYSFDELALAIQSHWDEARDLLKHGHFAQFFAGLGRGDLSRTAREATKLSDADQALNDLLRSLPASVVESPRILVEPGQVNLGTLRPGQDLRFDLHIANRGMGLMTGSISCQDATWLTLGDGHTHAREKVFQILHDLTVPVHVRGKSLTASSRPLIAKLLVSTNGGQTIVPVSVEVPVLPFPDGVLAGAITPRQIAQKARETPKEAAALFAKGAVARWYESNGWIYPVQEPSASGLAAVQQFFEALGLTTPPRVGITVGEIRLGGRAGESLRGSFQIVAQEKKPVFAHATSNQSWLRIKEVVLDGRTATIHLHVPEVPNCPGETFQARVSIVSNGRQRFTVPVWLAVTMAVPAVPHYRPPVVIEEVRPVDWPPPVRRKEEYDTVLPVVDRLEEVMPVRPRKEAEVHEDHLQKAEAPVRGSNTNRYLFATIPVLCLALGLMVTMVRDVAMWIRHPGGLGGPDAFGNIPQELEIHFHDREEQVQVAENGGVKPTGARFARNAAQAVWEPSMRFGLTLGGVGFGGGKRLTFEAKGLTNNTVVRLDGQEWIFGERPFRRLDRQPTGNWPGRWVEREAKLDRPLRNGRRSIWLYEAQQVYVTQTVGLVPGAQSGKLDTCLVVYKMENRDQRPHRVGLRFMLDTFIGGNDGVPFLIPGSPQLCNTMHNFPGPKQVPDFIQARETEDLERPGTIALIQLKVPGHEPPSRVTLGAWPNPELGPQCQQEKTLWNVPLLPIKALVQGDSAVTMYWDDRRLAAGESREVAFAYGLGSVAAGETGGQLGLSVVGSFTPGGEFTMTAEVRNPVHGQELTVDLPDGFSLISGQTKTPVPTLGANAPSRISPVTWKIKAGSREGTFTLTVRSSTGVAQRQSVQIKARGIFGN